jgi:hypothetical protein
LDLYIPEGMTAEGLMKIPGAKKYFLSKEDAEEWIKRISAVKKQAEEAGQLDPEVSPFVVCI